jgi:hypothetical protein
MIHILSWTRSSASSALSAPKSLRHQSRCNSLMPQASKEHLLGTGGFRCRDAAVEPKERDDGSWSSDAVCGNRCRVPSWSCGILAGRGSPSVSGNRCRMPPLSCGTAGCGPLAFSSDRWVVISHPDIVRTAVATSPATTAANR